MDEKGRHRLIEKIEPLWLDNCTVVGIISEKDFIKFSKNRKFVEVEHDKLLMNGDMVMWKRRYGYPREFFDDCCKVAKFLKGGDDFILLMPASWKNFPMFFKCTNIYKTLYIILAPRIMKEFIEKDDDIVEDEEGLDA